MKKRIVAAVTIIAFLCCLASCSERVKEYDETPITALTYTDVDYYDGFTVEYLFDFDQNIAVKHSFTPGDEERDTTEILVEFTEGQEKTLINKLYTYGFLDMEYESDSDRVKGGGWILEIEYSDGTSKKTCSNSDFPIFVFSKCSYAFFDICGDGVVADVPSEYYAPPNISYAVRYTEGNNTTSKGATGLDIRGNYKWNGFEESSQDYFLLNQEPSFPFPSEFDEDIEYKFVLYTSNYGIFENYDKFRECVVVSYDYNEELTGEEIVMKKGWFKQIEFDLQPNKIYVVKLAFKNGDFVEYTFNTKSD